MTTLIICLLIAVILPYLVKIPLSYAMHQAGGYDNHHPRAQQTTLQGFGARAVGAHQNGFESLIVFSTAALTAIATQQVTYAVQVLAIIYIVSRIIYNLLYLMNWATLRTTIWSLGFFCCIGILGLCIP
jgi:uncharacterized MAPEG superfamily protein